MLCKCLLKTLKLYKDISFKNKKINTNNQISVYNLQLNINKYAMLDQRFYA